MPKILFLKGLPAAGKSYFAKELIAKEPDVWVRVNKDSLRKQLHDGKWSKGREKTVMAIQREMARWALTSGMSVIVDDTNLSQKHEQDYREIARDHNAEFEVKIFDTSVDECIDRDLKRPDSVGKDVILKMYYQFLCDKTKEDVLHLPNAIICDVDGTLAKMENRGPFEWEKVGQDKINVAVREAITGFQMQGLHVLIVSGRDGCCEEQTRGWLKVNGVEYDKLWMRPTGNTEKDSIIKEKIYAEHIEGKYNIRCVFDDRPQVLRFWRKKGLFVMDCGLGYEF